MYAYVTCLQMDYMDLTRHFNVDIRALREEVQHTFRHADDRDQPSGLLRIAILNQLVASRLISLHTLIIIG
jgi:hypothetical protein